MREIYSAVLKSVFYTHLVKVRTRLGITQVSMAEQLAMDVRSYVELDHGKNLCSAVTLVLFLARCCNKEERTAFFDDVIEAFNLNDKSVCSTAAIS